MSPFNEKLQEGFLRFHPTASTVCNVGGLLLTCVKTGMAWEHASTEQRAGAIVMGAFEFMSLPCHLYGPITKHTDWYNERLHSALHLPAFALQASVVGMVSGIKAKHHSSSEPVDIMGWCVLGLGLVNLLLMIFANGFVWFKWIKESIEELIGISVE